MQEHGRRAQRLPAPPGAVWDSLSSPQMRGTWPWLNLVRDEVPPTVLEGSRPERVVWSSIWPDRPRDRVVLVLTDLRFSYGQ